MHMLLRMPALGANYCPYTERLARVLLSCVFSLTNSLVQEGLAGSGSTKARHRLAVDSPLQGC